VKAEIFSIGTELLMGELTDTNAAWMAARLPALGIQLQGISIIGDSLAMLTEGLHARCSALTLSSPRAVWAPPRTT
jgi:nicotinamide-nucleotide amidase